MSGFGAIAAIFVALASTAAGAAPAPSFQTFAMSWSVQGVCLDPAGKVVASLAPTSAACRQSRPLRPGEPLPYHKHDWPSARWPGPPDPRGMQRSDSFPAMLGGQAVAVQTFDFGPATHRRFGVFDPGDGGQIVGASNGVASILMTQDHPDQLKFFFGPDCPRPASLAALQGGWVLFDQRAQAGVAAARTSVLREMPNDGACPFWRYPGLSQWRFADIRYRASLAGGLTAPLHSLVSDHFSSAAPTTAGAMERMYLTRELGWTRWEAWRRPVLLGPSADDIARQAAALAASRRCDPRYLAPPGDGWRLVDCREWTNIQPPAVPAGDPPTFWIDRLTAAHLFR